FFRGAFVTLGAEAKGNGTGANGDSQGGNSTRGGGNANGSANGTAELSRTGSNGNNRNGARAGVDMSSVEPVELPVHVKVTEAPARTASGSLGADSDHGVRVEGLYRQNIVFGAPVWIETGLGLDRKRQRVFFDVHLPPTLDGYHDSFGLLYEHTDIEGLENSRSGIGWTRTQKRPGASGSRVDYETQFGALVTYDKTKISGGERYEVPSWSVNWKWLRRDVDKKYDPREGNLLEVGLGAGTTLDDWTPFYRASVRAQRWWPIGQNDVLTVRGEVGKVWSDTTRLPQDFSFRTGGSRTVRGYRYQGIGIESGDAIIGAPVLAVGSIEYVHYFTDLLGASVFVDAGDAAPSFSELDWHVGYGAGLAVRTPAGPFYVDLAWAQKDRRLRLHFSLGIAF
ncbi:MAG TPA: BamA/TamA family outer membrane protein, partial [Castellaniella sp.]|nr:BamA/TamA family outer membrane protein [Castellaniella sp.]